jgi:uncharacterized membrane protein YvbJ
MSMVFCTKCGFEVTEESSEFCPKCGTNVIKNTESKEPKTDSQIDSVPNISTKTPSKGSNKKTIAIAVVLSVITVFIIVPFIAGSIDNFPESLREYYSQQNKAEKEIECSENQDSLYQDVYDKYCCESETIILMPIDGPRCPLS